MWYGFGPVLTLPNVAKVMLSEIDHENTLHLEVEENGDLAPKMKDSWPMKFKQRPADMFPVLKEYLRRMTLPEHRAEFAREAFQQLPIQEALIGELFNYEPDLGPCVSSCHYLVDAVTDSLLQASLMREVTAHVVAVHLSTRVLKPTPNQAQALASQEWEIQVGDEPESLSVQPLSPQVQRALLYMSAHMERSILGSLDDLFQTYRHKAWCTGFLALAAIAFAYQSLAMLRYAYDCFELETGNLTAEKRHEKKAAAIHSYEEIRYVFEYLIGEFHKLSARLSTDKAAFNPLGIDKDLYKLDEESQALVRRLRSIWDNQSGHTHPSSIA